MKTLLILRHAKSNWDHENLADHDRPLKARGKQDAPRIGTLIRAEGLVPDLILCSSAKRARTTAELVADACGYDESDIVFTRDLFHAWESDYIDLLKSVDENFSCVMVVGHNPGLEGLVNLLTDEDVWLPTAALVQVELDLNHWNEFGDETEGRMINLWRPRDFA